MIACECHQCDERLWAEDADAGRKIKCPKCKALVKVPDPAATPPVVRVEHPGLTRLNVGLHFVVWWGLVLIMATFLIYLFLFAVTH
jgi:phage FluMu protein Com